jgi:iron(III) transport system permease protein
VVAPSSLALLPASGAAGRLVAALLGSPLAATALWAGIAATLAVPVAWLLAWRAREAAFWRVVACAVVALGLGTPGPVVGMGLELAYLPVRWIHGTPLIVVACFVVRILPYLLLVLAPAVGAIPQVQLDIAAISGLDSAAVGRRVVWPMTRAARRAAWAVAFVLAWGELAASNILLPPGVRTLAFQVWSLVHYGTESHLAGVGLILVGIYGAAGALAVGALARAARTA